MCGQPKYAEYTVLFLSAIQCKSQGTQLYKVLQFQCLRNLLNLILTTGLAAASGLSATMLLTHLLKSGEHILCVDDVYGGTNYY